MTLLPSTYIEDIATHEGQQVTLAGWIYNKTEKGKLIFVQLRDGTGVIQCVVFKKNVSEETFKAAQELGQESSCYISGNVRADPRAPTGYELDVVEVRAVAPSHDYPISPKEHGTEFLMQHRHLW